MASALNSRLHFLLFPSFLTVGVGETIEITAHTHLTYHLGFLQLQTGSPAGLVPLFQAVFIGQ